MSKIKVGDRIRIYHDGFINTGDVEIIEDKKLVHYKCDKSDNSYLAHIKQCRKLVKKEPREWWVNTKEYGFDSMFGAETGVMCRTTKPDDTEGWICLREVKKK